MLICFFLFFANNKIVTTKEKKDFFCLFVFVLFINFNQGKKITNFYILSSTNLLNNSYFQEIGLLRLCSVAQRTQKPPPIPHAKCRCLDHCR